MSLAEVRDGWDKAACADAMGNILTEGWPDPEAFYATGRAEIEHLMGRLDCKRGRALDFGCGIGRLTVALAEYFDRVSGVDISPEMVARAREHPRVEYHVAETLTVFPAVYDLVFSTLTLQHVDHEHQRRYVGEFMGLLARGGAAVFEIPEGPQMTHPSPWLSMWGTPRETVDQWVDEAGGRVVDIENQGGGTWVCQSYTVVKEA